MVYISTSCLKRENSKFTKDVFRVLEIYKRYNIKNIELGSVHSYVKDLTKIKKYQKENEVNFIIHGFFPPSKKPFFLNFASKNKDVLRKSMKVAKNAIELCNELNSNIYSIHGGFYCDVDIKGNAISKRIPYGEAIEIAAESFSEICDYASNYNIKVAVENMAGILKDAIFINYNDFNNLFKKLNVRNFGILFDIGHAAVTKIRYGIDTKEIIDKLKNKIFEIHINKSVGEEDTHLNIDSPDLLKDFDKDTLKKVVLTLEATNLRPNEILKGKEIIEKALTKNANAFS